MTIYYCAENNGFYDSEFHSEQEIPKQVVEITEQTRTELLEANSAGKNIVADKNGFPIVEKIVIDAETLKKNAIEKLKNQLASIDTESLTDRTWREYVIAHAADFSHEALSRLQEYENKAIALREQLNGLLNVDNNS